MTVAWIRRIFLVERTSAWHPCYMGWSLKRRRHVVDVSLGSDVIDVTAPPDPRLVDLSLSIHETPGDERRFGAALCMLSGPLDGAGHVESTGSVVPIGRRPHVITREQFLSLLEHAAASGHLSDGFLEIQASVDLSTGTVVWSPESGDGVELPHLDEVVENAISAFAETNILGEWFAPTAVVRYGAIVANTTSDQK